VQLGHKGFALLRFLWAHKSIFIFKMYFTP